ncbi:UDP-N-acetylglucosamine--N-acetylmuramyl-(pentapeptide) pyrophosphoryl-undecaprenol N-acetylglucosamine transferase [Candidatus Vecturithrix granuli]|uniref:UDP-N-acetylglucosamine--N-acetylmuramyl-(pentapeptide) pyrophosphoryl-undecaprenol N-acetylglucosamine transferase n=1 Tax=Vecturithrix granuli TaxID=1499967 RepID=A0A0S6W9R8_VECG1|nr:UDP-N-acetylglucosamine--N-acetylmuramyl-(pentapeptide) pyrophosphoryl-undecaprenol N-acetylglucosamine transferase [Candidatus Vecturithrix granuli]
MKRIILTGGGTAGHVTPNIALLPGLRSLGFEIHYVGQTTGIERQLIEPEGIPYHPIPAGKLRRYIDLKNVRDIFLVIAGFLKACLLLYRIKPHIIFSKGGFVSCPLVWAAWLHRIPAILHESDLTPGLANKLSLPFAVHICYSFPETAAMLPSGKATHTGIPIRESLQKGEQAKGRELCGFTDTKPVVLIIGGSQGSETINHVIRNALQELQPQFQICHICGPGNIQAEIHLPTPGPSREGKLQTTPGYAQFEYVDKELPHLLALANVVVSRAGATTIFELLTLRKPNLLIPLSRKASRGDQVLNAQSFAKQGFSRVLEEEDLTVASLIENIRCTYEQRQTLIQAMNAATTTNGIEQVIEVIQRFVR